MSPIVFSFSIKIIRFTRSLSNSSSFRCYSIFAPCFLTDASSHYRITVALSKKPVTAATPEPVASSRRNVREQSRVVYHLVTIQPLFRRVRNGVWRSGLARMVWDHEVGGSNPLTPTILEQRKPLSQACRTLISRQGAVRDFGKIGASSADPLGNLRQDFALVAGQSIDDFSFKTGCGIIRKQRATDGRTHS